MIHRLGSGLRKEIVHGKEIFLLVLMALALLGGMLGVREFVVAWLEAMKSRFQVFQAFAASQASSLDRLIAWHNTCYQTCSKLIGKVMR